MLRTLFLLSLALLTLLPATGCGTNPTPPLAASPGSDTPADGEQATALGTVAVQPRFPAGIAPARLALNVTGTDTTNPRKERQLYSGAELEKIALPAGRNRLFVLKGYGTDGELRYSGAQQTDIIAGQHLELPIALWPAQQNRTLTFSGIGEGFSLRFALQTEVTYLIRIRYIERITVDLLDGLRGDKSAVVLDESGISAETVRTNRVLQVGTTGGFFLNVRNTSKLWRIDIESY